ncbi:MAG TPA: hypothetical protein VJ461_03675 [Candidatus Nanoarchaeia archaeon]|nr:hypothetical protein [Candidatus Nanoarchaeia archaeon]
MVEETDNHVVKKTDSDITEEKGLLSFLKNYPQNIDGRTTKNIFFNWIRKKQERLSYFIGLSLLAHMTMLGSIMMFRAANNPKPVKSTTEYRAVQEALRDINLTTLSSILTDKDILTAIPYLDENLTAKEQADIFKAIISKSMLRLKEQNNDGTITPQDMVAMFKDLQEFETSQGSRLYRFDDGVKRESKFFSLTKERYERLQTLKQEENIDKRQTKSGDVEVWTGKSFVRVPKEYYFHKAPYEQMLATGSRLFYAVEGFPMLEMPGGAMMANEDSYQIQKVKTIATKKPTEFSIFLLPRSKITNMKPKPIYTSQVTLTKENISTILDDLMQLNEVEQIKVFDRDYLQKYDPQNYLLASLTGDFIYKNLGIVFILQNPLSTGFDFLEQLYYRKQSFDKFITYWHNNPNTQTGIEILFCLAAFYDFERRSLLYLHESAEVAEKVLRNEAVEFDVFNKQTKAYVLHQTYQDLVSQIQGRGVLSLDSVLKTYEEQQAKIYHRLISMGGDIKNRARFSLGVLYWDEARSDRAIRTWKEIDSSYFTPCLDQIRKIIASNNSDENSRSLVSRIDNVLNAEDAKNRHEFLGRLTQYHKWEKRLTNAH